MKPSLAKGTRDFSAEEIQRRRLIIQTLQNNFENFGYLALETPSFENLSTLTGKYGEEGDRLIFKILESGDFFKNKRENIQEFLLLNNDFYYFLNKSIFDLSNDFTFTDFQNKYKIEYINKFFQSEATANSIIEIRNQIAHGKYDSLEIALGDSRVRKVFDTLKYLYQLGYFNNVVLDSKSSTRIISDKALRYDLTVPFARYVAMNHGQLNFPFKRYQIQPVWRADRPQKGRYREFLQCDADVVGSTSLWQEVELVQLYLKSFQDLKIPVKIHINNRKILTGLAEYANIADQIIDFTVALDKLDKIGKEGVEKELLNKNISEETIEKLSFLFENKPQNEILKLLKEYFAEIEIGKKGVEELEFVLENCKNLGIENELVFDITLARGLDYYTGAILEVKAENVAMGSVGGGGRYDNLTEVFGVKNVPGIGISFGLDRIYLVMEELNLFAENSLQKLEYLFANYGEKEALASFKIIKKLREKNVSAELYPDVDKMKKFFNYSEKRGVENLVFLGEEEITAGNITIKNQTDGSQKTITQEDFLNQF